MDAKVSRELKEVGAMRDVVLCQLVALEKLQVQNAENLRLLDFLGELPLFNSLLNEELHDV